MSRRSRLASMALLTSGVLVGVGIAPAYASTCANNHFCAWNGNEYTGSILLDASGIYTDNTYIDVADNLTSSAKNVYSNRTWCGWNENWPWDNMLFLFAKQTEVGVLGSSADNKIDYFRVRTGTSC